MNNNLAWVKGIIPGQPEWVCETIAAEFDLYDERLAGLGDENRALRAKLAEPRPLPLAAKHAGTKISAEGVLGRIRDGRYFVGPGWGCGEMLRHLEEMAGRFYAGDIAAVDEFLQLYCLDHKRPEQEPPT